MNIFKRVGFPLFLLMFQSFCFANIQQPKGGQVVLDWNQFIKLWKDANTPPKPPKPDDPPVDYILSRAKYSGHVLLKTTEIQADIEFNILNDEKWVRVPFLPQSLGLKEVRLNGKPVTVTHENGQHALILKGAGHYNLKAVFAIPTPNADGAPVIQFPILETSMTLLSLTFPKKNLEVKVLPSQFLSTKSENGKTSIQAILPPSRYIRLTWSKKLPPGRVIPAKIYSNLEELLTIHDSSIKVHSHFQYSILHSGIREMEIEVPRDVTILNVKSPNLQTWNEIEEKGKKILKVMFNKKVQGSYRITLVAEAPLEKGYETRVPFFRSLNVEREEGAIGIEAKSNVQVSIKNQSGLRQVDVKEVPVSLWNRASNPLLYAFLFTKPSGQLSLNIERHEDVPVLTSTIDSSNAVTVLTKDGQWITRVSFEVRNHLKQFLALDLPKDAHIWSAFVSGKPVKPSKNKKGQILIPLNKSTLSSQQEAFPLEVIYHVQDKRLGYIGNRSAFLPKVDLPVSQLLWSLYVPEDYRFMPMGGNLDEPGWSHRPYDGLLAQNKSVSYRRRELAPDEKEVALERAASEIQRGFDDEGKGQAGGGLFKASSAKKQASLELDTISLNNHVLPISFRIPVSGRLYRFGKIMITESVPQINMNYVRASLIGGFKFSLFGFVVFLLYRSRQKIKVKVALVSTKGFEWIKKGSKAISRLRKKHKTEKMT